MTNNLEFVLLTYLVNTDTLEEFMGVLSFQNWFCLEGSRKAHWEAMA